MSEGNGSTNGHANGMASLISIIPESWVNCQVGPGPEFRIDAFETWNKWADICNAHPKDTPMPATAHMDFIESIGGGRAGSMAEAANFMKRLDEHVAALSERIKKNSGPKAISPTDSSLIAST